MWLSRGTELAVSKFEGKSTREPIQGRHVQWFVFYIAFNTLRLETILENNSNILSLELSSSIVVISVVSYLSCNSKV